ncbi:hypothetical protein F4781DRAFT_211644 [Annulohypoxylon bovei var. microspora]|nr:hypothetical protein F4781DRAFT_211644 [Annulohypoxylon bovei var. microspora]
MQFVNFTAPLIAVPLAFQLPVDCLGNVERGATHLKYLCIFFRSRICREQPQCRSFALPDVDISRETKHSTSPLFRVFT